MDADRFMNENWYRNGLKFSCQQCGLCCWDEGEYTEVYVTQDDIRQMAAYEHLLPHEFYSKYVKKSEDGFNVLMSGNGACIMLHEHQCRVYPVRPKQCRTWPFWPETLKRHVWYREVRKRCPGAGKGRRYSVEEIEEIMRTGKGVS